MLDFSVTFVITIINIAVLFLILRLILFKPVTKFMDERAKRVQASFDQAEKNNIEAEKLLAQYEKMLKNAEVEASEILRAARENAAAEAKRIVTEGKTQAAEIAAQAQKQLEMERRIVLAKLNAEAVVLVMAAASKLASREISGDDNRRYANMLLEQLAVSNEQLAMGN